MSLRNWMTCCALVMCASLAAAQDVRHITTPMEALGFNLGDDYRVANYTQLDAYWKKMATESDRMKLVDIGLTSEGRHQWMAIITSPENLKKLDYYRDISSKLAHAEGLTDEQAHALAKEGKAVVWIDGGLHASETVGSQQIMEEVYELNSQTDEETMRFLNDDITLCVLDNPDGQELVANWYMREPVPEKRVANVYAFGVPRLWHKYAGHDDNRDFFMSNLMETTNINRVLFREWYPQIMYNHHQTGPVGTVIFMPPFRDPFNYHFDPLIPLDIESLGSAMHSRLVAEGKPGSTMRSGATYSTWYNGGLRTVTYFHNMIGILTEIIGSPTPMQLPLVASKQLPTGDLPDPVAPQLWHYKQSIEYEMTNNRAVLDYASRNRETLLFNTYRMGKNSIDRGNTDSWTVTPKRITALDAAAAAAPKEKPGEGGPESVGLPAAATIPSNLYAKVLHDPAYRDPRGYILPSDQPDFPTATKFVNTLLKNGVEVMQATAAFDVAGKHYPAGSYVVKSSQAYRPQVLDIFEPQDHPNDFKFPGGPPVPPYDVTGYTLAMQMGVTYDRVLEGFNGPFKEITSDLASPLPGVVDGPAKPAGYLISHQYNDAYTLTNRLLKAKCEVDWLTAEKAPDLHVGGTGALWIPYSPAARDLIVSAAKTLGISAYGQKVVPTAKMIQLHPVRIGLFDQYGGLMPSGWTRWLLEQYEFPYELVFPKGLDAGELKKKFDVLIFTDGAIRAAAFEPSRGHFDNQPAPESIPAEFRPWLGNITREKTLPQLRTFMEQGGAVLTIGSSTALSQLLSLPMENGLTEIGASGKQVPLPHEKFYVPGSLLRAQIDNTNPLAYGMPSSVDVFFDNSPSFRLLPNAALEGVSAVGWYHGPKVLESGWAWGQEYLSETVAVASAKVGKGRLFLFGPEIAFRGQPHATFKLLFNGILYGPTAAN